MYTPREALLTVTIATMPQAAPEEPPFDERFEALLERGRTEYAEDRLGDSLRTFEEAERFAERAGDPRSVDRAFANRCSVLMMVERGLPAEMLQRLREILVAGHEAVNVRLAAYNIARAYEFQKEFRKGLFYARIALDRSRLLDSADWLASSHNQIGNLLLAESHFEAGCHEYEVALDLLPTEPSRRKALIFTNLGYALVVLGRPQEGLSYLYRSLRMLRGLGAHREQIIPHLDLSFALLEVGRYRYALAHGARALALAEEADEQDSIKHALFLLGETAQQAGDPKQARAIFERLQDRYFPGATYLPEVLLAVDVRKLINLKA